MSDFINNIRSLPDFYASFGASDEQISHAEQELEVRFASDYREYLRAFGTACANGHELTGICSAKRLNVTDVTLYEREQTPNIPRDWYVLEQANIDDIAIWQNERGEIYQTMPGTEFLRIGNSILAYMQMG